MSDQLTTALISAIVAIATSVGVILLERRMERYRHAQSARKDLLKPIEDWLSNAQEMNMMLEDTVVNARFGNLPETSHDKRREVYQFMIRETNRVWGILNSRALNTRETIKPAVKLKALIGSLDDAIKQQLLPLDTSLQIQVRSFRSQAITSVQPDDLANGIALKVNLDSQIQNAHSLLAELKTTLN